MIVTASYVIAALTISGAGLYLTYRLSLYVTASPMLLGFLLIVYGPAYLAYMVLRRPSSVVDRQISNSLNFDDIVVSLNLWIAIMFVCVIAFFESLIVWRRARPEALQRDFWPEPSALERSAG